MACRTRSRCEERRNSGDLSIFGLPLLLAVACGTLAATPPALSPGLVEPSFHNVAGVGYVWRNRSMVAVLKQAGTLSLQLAKAKPMRITLAGARPAASPQGEAASSAANYYLGPASHWHSSAQFERIRYRDIYPGVDLVLGSHSGQLEYRFELRPHADPSRITFRYRRLVSLSEQGDLLIRTGSKLVRQHRPRAFQNDEAGNHEIACTYRRSRPGEVQINVADYDPTRPLVIDPVLNFSSYLGGPSFDAIYAAATDASGNLYVTGETSSLSITGGSSASRPSRDVLVAKLDSTGTHLLYVTYAGGGGNDSGRGIAVDPSGNAYVTGVTASADFPATSGAFRSHISGSENAFVLKLNSSGQLQYSTYLGGGTADYGFAIAVDSGGAAYVAGQTRSVSFPTTAGALQTSYHGGLSDCFVTKLNPVGNALLYSTYLGGAGLDLCSGVAVDASGNAYVTGTTYSWNFPTLAPFLGSLRGSANAFVAKINPTGSGLVYSTYLGGSILENANAIAVDSGGAAYVAGCTASPDFPTTTGAAQTVLKGMYNAFVSKITASGSSLIYSTLIGGSGSDNAMAIALDANLQAVVSGYTTSIDFPTVNTSQPFRGAFDAFAAVLNVAGTSVVFSSYFGGSGDDRGYAVAALAGNRVLLAGATASRDFPTASAIQSSLGGSYDAFALGVQYEAVSARLAFYPLAPCRVVDTRSGTDGSGKTGAFGPPFMPAGTTRDFPILASSCNVPSTAQVYSFNITVVPHEPLASLTVWPTGTPRPPTIALAASARQIVADAAIAQGGTGGAVSVYASNATDVIIDINGYFAPPGTQGLAFYPAPPCRIADTRSGTAGSGKTGAFGPPQMTAGSTRSFPILSSSCNLPAAAQAYSLNLTVVPPGPMFYLTTWPTGQPIPWVSTLNDLSGVILANAAIVPAGINGAISVFVSNANDVIIDINGYFAPPGGPGALWFYPVPPCRVADTRSGSGKTGAFGPPRVTAGSTRDFPIPSSGCGVPAGSQAYSLNVTVMPPDAMLYLTIWPTGQSIPWVSTLNDLSGWTVANTALVPAGTNGSVSVYVYAATDVIIDIGGYFGN